MVAGVNVTFMVTDAPGAKLPDEGSNKNSGAPYWPSCGIFKI